MKRAVLILGAGSEIARGAAVAWGRRGHSLFLAGRDQDDLSRTAADLNIRFGVAVKQGVFDAEDASTYEAIIAQAGKEFGQLAGVLIAFGYNGEQRLAETNAAEAARIMHINFVGAALMAHHAAGYLLPFGAGFIIGISSVAGDRGRQSNFVYGASKGGFSVFLQGLRNRLAAKGIHVMTVKPGFVDTAMTYGKPKLFAVASPAKVGERLVEAVEARRDIVYIPGFWRLIMLVICAIPERLFKRLSL